MTAKKVLPRVMHGEAGGRRTPEYRTWKEMRQRCENPNNDSYHYYGARGVKVCERWSLYANFLADMGRRPAGMSIDRIDSNGDYEPNNCKWSTTFQQSRNRRYVQKLEFRGETLPLPDWADRMGISAPVLRARILRYGWSTERALTEKLCGYPRRPRNDITHLVGEKR